MGSVRDDEGLAILRQLAQVSLLAAIASLLVSAGTAVLLTNASSAGQWIVIACGAALSASAFTLGAMISLRSKRARRAGFVTIGMVLANAVLFVLLTIAVPEQAWPFVAWTLLLLAYAAYATHRVVRWPTGELSDVPESSLAVFISYRRDDSRETVGRIHDHLREAFEDEGIFLDVDRQAPGEDYREVIGRALDGSDVVLAVIGTRWLTITGRDGRRRLDNPGDMVRIELETALERNMRIVPVLVDNAGMPAAADVPPSLAPLCYLSALPVRPDPDFKRDVRLLIDAVCAGRAAASPPAMTAGPRS